MRKFYLRSVINGSPDNNIFEADGFAKAEKKAKEMLLNLIKDVWAVSV